MGTVSPIVLVVESEELVLDVTVEALTRLGFPTTGAPTAATAINIAEKLPSLQLVLSEVYLKDATGPELIRHVCRNRPELKVVFMSAVDTDINFRRTDRVLMKPFRLESLAQTVDSVLGQETVIPECRVSGAERRRTSQMH